MPVLRQAVEGMLFASCWPQGVVCARNFDRNANDIMLKPTHASPFMKCWGAGLLLFLAFFGLIKRLSAQRMSYGAGFSWGIMQLPDAPLERTSCLLPIPTDTITILTAAIFYRKWTKGKNPIEWGLHHAITQQTYNLATMHRGFVRVSLSTYLNY